MRPRPDRTVVSRAARHIALAGACTVLLSAGCGSGDPFDYVKVRGKVTYEDGSLIPVKQIDVVFLPQPTEADPKIHPRPGRAQVNVEDGTFDVVTSHKYGDGIVAGRHKVLVLSLDDERMSPTDAVPAQYGDAARTPLEVDAADSPFHLKVRRTKP